MNSKQKLAQHSEIASLTGLRFLAALFVFISHGIMLIMPANGPTPFWYNFLMRLSAEGMTLFFVLSGFVIHYNYSTPIKNNPVLGVYNFVIARIARLYPLFLVGLAFDFTHLYGYSSLTNSFWKVIPYYLTLTQSWFYAVFGNNSLIYQFGHIPALSWSVSTEWSFYMIYPMICFGLLKITKVRALGITFTMTILLALLMVALLCLNEPLLNNWAARVFGPVADESNGFQDSFYRWLIYFSPYTRICEFLLGCLTAAIYLKVKDIPLQPRDYQFGKKLIIASLIGVIIFYYLGFCVDQLLNGFVKKLTFCFGFAPFAAAIIFCCARYPNTFSRFFSKKIFLTGGEASYSLYLFHMTVIQAFARDAAAVSSSTSWIVYAADLSRLILAFAASMGLALLFYRAIEVPSRRFLRKIFTIREKTPVAELQTLIN